ncbi:MAG: family 65 glycosyl hydrolase domain-containing protein [Bacteroidales bacterium]|nr:family 65 glycosyl hydrolase domain-containing protein [Bacteroidales bacterium]
MNSCYKKDEWLIIEEGFHPELNRESESIFSIGNGYMGQRANFEEHYSGDSLQGSYIAGVYYPDKTRVGWWKNGYPEYFAKVLNAPNWIGIDVSVNGKTVDLATARIISFSRILNMREGYLERSFRILIAENKTIEINSRRFLSMAEPDLGIIKYSVKSANFAGTIDFTVYIDADVRNEDANYGKKFWKEVRREVTTGTGIIITRTMKTDFHVATGMCYELHGNKKPLHVKPSVTDREKFVANTFSVKTKPGDELTIVKYVSVLSSLNNPKDVLMTDVKKRLKDASSKGYAKLFSEHKSEWGEIWDASDVVIEGDIAAQQAIRFNIFQLNQTYTGKDERLNIGPKGFTGEKYGGSTYWDTEAFALPFFLKTADQKVARNLLLYRYKHLGESIKNAEKLGFKNGAALYPMVTMNGEECHNEWEITFEEIHRNGAIAYAIYNYNRHTGDNGYMADYGLEVLIGISRFWSQRATWSEEKKKYMILGVTGPNEYENNVNNNWYTNTMAVWTLSYTISNLLLVSKETPGKYEKIIRKTDFDFTEETGYWQKVIDKMHMPYDDKRKVFLQQDGFLDKELLPAEKIPPEERPINQHWSWDRILRSCYIKQADVLHGLYVLEDKYDIKTVKRNFDFYEPMTVHESSLSACIHSIVASRIGNIRKAYELYLRTARLDLDDYNNEVGDGLHITSMAGTWLAIVEGFGGMRILDSKVRVNPLIPEKWTSYSFQARFRSVRFEVKVTHTGVIIKNKSDRTLKMIVFDKEYQIHGSEEKQIEL